MFIKGQVIGFVASIKEGPQSEFISFSIVITKEGKPPMWVNCFARENLKIIAKGYQTGDLIWAEGDMSLYTSSSTTTFTISVSALRRVWIRKERERLIESLTPPSEEKEIEKEPEEVISKPRKKVKI